VVPPAGNGTMMRTGLEGKGCAHATPHSHAKMKIAPRIASS
jgi:hypothetical protein